MPSTYHVVVFTIQFIAMILMIWGYFQISATKESTALWKGLSRITLALYLMLNSVVILLTAIADALSTTR